MIVREDHDLADDSGPKWPSTVAMVAATALVTALATKLAEWAVEEIKDVVKKRTKPGDDAQ